MTEIKEFKKEIQQVKMDQKDIQRDIRNMESRITITEKDILTINKQLEKISSNTTWILRLIIGSLLTGALGMVLKAFM
ncbi:hemolysin XhlA family protein [Peribacillus simplex]|uniref:Hemolysin XhlA family protein n=2 Tax=Peribacillus TaxID=2675229 RepID=A0AA90T2L3_9BACI|nr:MULTISPECIES: hemolysin XhlA family protein [Peribacillus]MDP1420368.1 hemolysin XhlA family protein [Peribacillus simplex]MDP1453449.1 hemolysin XhlA family protein [Peribacillus frigoritolerans]